MDGGGVTSCVLYDIPYQVYAVVEVVPQAAQTYFFKVRDDAFIFRALIIIKSGAPENVGAVIPLYHNPARQRMLDVVTIVSLAYCQIALCAPPLYLRGGGVVFSFFA